MIYIVTTETLSEDLTWFYPVRFADLTTVEKTIRLEHHLMYRYSPEVRAGAFLAVLKCGDWLSRHKATLIRGKWLGDTWLGNALAQALCEKALTFPMFEISELMCCPVDEIIDDATTKLQLR